MPALRSAGHLRVIDGRRDDAAASDDADEHSGPSQPPSRNMDDIVHRLDELLRTIAAVPSPASAAAPIERNKLDAARAEWNARRERERLFGSSIFGDAGWDILLDLFMAREEGRDVTLSSIYEAASLAESAMLRCLAMLIDEGLIVRESRSPDPRGTHLRLSGQALALMCEYFSRTKTGSGDAGA
ncbi:MAG: hypothetical protein M3N39_04640 [Pseudomonadota bacterium]|nr:hypothetical protein [Pseudomonadota bacterium]